jgi:hypothetical protein
MKHLSKITVSIVFLFACICANGQDCEAPLRALHQTLNVTSERHLLEKLHHIYESTSQSDASSRSGSSLGIKVDGYGDGLWKSNKEKISSLYKRHYEDVNYQYTLDEKIDLYYSFYKSEDFKVAVDAWSACGPNNGIIKPILSVSNKDQVVVSFKMSPNDYNGPEDRVKVRNIFYSQNLQLVESSIPKNNKIKYSGEYTLAFKRTSNDAGLVKIDLAKGKIVPVVISEIKPQPQMIRVKEVVYVPVSSNMSANWLKTQYDTQQFVFPNQSRSHYVLDVTNRRTNIKNLNHAKIEECFYIPITGGIGDFKFQSSSTDNSDNTFLLNFYFVSGHKKMTGKIGVVYSYLKPI